MENRLLLAEQGATKEKLVDDMITHNPPHLIYVLYVPTHQYVKPKKTTKK